MGTAGNRTGYKIFSINTTLRNPKRNSDFLLIFKKYDGMVFDEIVSYNFYTDIVRNGVYQLSDVPQAIKLKIESDEILTNDEVTKLIIDNPQATGIKGRVITQLRALKEVGFLKFEKGKGRNIKISMTPLGKQLISGEFETSTIYTKAMLGMSAKSPVRSTIKNESMPFLNTIFVINRVKQIWSRMGFEAKGVLRHEFGAFILSMKDCDWEKAAQNIIKYRQKFKYEVDETYITKYLKDNGILDYGFKTIISEYPDDVFRKFEMTQLIISRGQYSYIYYDFSKYNYEKIQMILKKYDNFVFKDYLTQDDYYNAMQETILPWEKDERLKKQIIESKALSLNVPIPDSLSLKEQEFYLDRMFYKNALDKAINETTFDAIGKELMILSGNDNSKSKYEDLTPSLRLEYLLALLLGKQYGIRGLVSNIIYNEEGMPLSHAPAGKSDILYHHEDGTYILEPTMLRTKDQILNSETTNIVRHLKNEERKYPNLQFRVFMVAPRVHSDVADFFKYKAQTENVKILPLTITKTVYIIKDNQTILSLNKESDLLVERLIANKDKFVDEVNAF